MIKNILVGSNFPCFDILWDNDTVVTGGRCCTIKFWYLKSNTSIVPTALCYYEALQLKFSPKEKLLAIATTQNSLVLHHLTSLKKFILVCNETGIGAITFSNDGNLLAVSTNAKLLIWDVKTKKCIHKFAKQGLDSCSFSADDNYLAGSYNRLSVKIWTIERSSKKVKFNVKHTIPLQEFTECFSFSPTNNKLLATPWSLYNVETGKEVAKLEHGERVVNDIVYSPDGDTVAICCPNRMIRLCNAKSGRCFESWVADYIRQLKFSPDGHRLLTCSLHQFVTIWNVFNSRYVAKFALVLLFKKVSNFIVLDIVNFILSQVKKLCFQSECDYASARKTFLINMLRKNQSL